jgi:hypothetical protein
MEITINEKTYEPKYSFRSLMIYERLTDKSFEAKGLNEIITFMYSCLAASDVTFTVEFDDFINWLDDNPTKLEEFTQWLLVQLNRSNNLDSGTEKKNSKIKKK